jgi:hypothetical protein
MCLGGKHLFEEVESSKKKKGMTEEEIEAAESDEDYDENAPVRPKRPVKMELYNVEEVAKILRDLKAKDVAVVDISQKVDWVNYMVFATGTLSFPPGNNCSLILLLCRKIQGTYKIYCECIGNGIKDAKAREAMGSRPRRQ